MHSLQHLPVSCWTSSLMIFSLSHIKYRSAVARVRPPPIHHHEADSFSRGELLFMLKRRVHVRIGHFSMRLFKLFDSAREELESSRDGDILVLAKTPVTFP